MLESKVWSAESLCYHYCLYQLVSPSKVCHGVEDEPPLMRMRLEDAAKPLLQQQSWLAMVKRHDSYRSQPNSAPLLHPQAHLQGDGRPAFERR